MATYSAPNQGSRAIAVARIATAVFFLFFGEYKVFGSAFAHGGFQEYLQGYLNGSAVSFYRPVLANLVLPHAVFFGYLVGVAELFIGISLLLGIYLRAGSIVGMLHMISLAMATWWEPGHGVPTWRYFGAELDHLPLLLLFIVFYANDAGQTWGLDGWRGRKHENELHSAAQSSAPAAR
ncbi:MAG TPA: DoxX family protein [Terriglobales bacterium]|nr:DoxX family protein [Terriglobales bacterium]